MDHEPNPSNVSLKWTYGWPRLLRTLFSSARPSRPRATVGEAMSRRFMTLSASEPIAIVAEDVIHGAQNDFPVLDRGELVGMLSRGDAMIAVGTGQAEASVDAFMRHVVQTASPRDDLAAVLKHLGRGSGSICVVDGERLVGLLTEGVPRG
jgi:CBS domain-containing protein